MAEVPQQKGIAANNSKPAGFGRIPAAAPTSPKKPVNKIKPSSDLGKEVLICATAVLALVAAAFIFVSVTNAKTGFFDVPWLVTHYVPDAPVRRVTYTPMTWEELSRYVTQCVNKKNQEHGPPLEVALSETQMTGVLVDSLALDSRNQSTRVRLVQMAVAPDGIEMIVRLTWRNIFNLDLSGRFIPSVTPNGDLHFEAAQAKLGHVGLPNSWLWSILGFIFNRDLEVWQIKVGDVFIMRDVKLSDGVMNLSFGPAAETQP